MLYEADAFIAAININGFTSNKSMAEQHSHVEKASIEWQPLVMTMASDDYAASLLLIQIELDLRN